MATSKPFSRHAEAPLREILWTSQIDSLPEEVRKSESFRWLMRRDDSRSRRANFEHDEHQDEDYRRLFRRLSESGECDRQTLSRLLKPIANTLLAPVLQSRYQRAIDIGMRWRNARNRHRWTRNSNDPENFEMTVAVNLKGLEARGTYVAEDELRTGFAQFLRDAGKSADQELREVQAEWRRWEQQVANLREDATAVENELNDLEPTSALIYAWLRFSIIRESYGSSERASAFETGPLFFTLIVSMFAGRKRGLHPDFEFAFRHIDHVFHTMNDEIRYGAARRRQLARLEQKYETENPFDAYAPLRRPADEELIRLVDEHTLVDRQPSPFLQQWRERLTEPPFWSGHYSDPMPFSKKDDSKSLERTADWADSLIKRKIGAVNRSRRDEVRPHGWETVSDCCRRIWINDWVMWIINNLTPRENKSVDARWTKDAVFEFVESVRRRLVSQGYSFDALSDDEKARLWKS